MYVKVDDQKVAIGTLSTDKYPQIQFDLVFEKEFELSHTSKAASVFFSGYKVLQPVEGDEYPSYFGINNFMMFVVLTCSMLSICFLDQTFSLVPQWMFILKKMKVMHINSTSSRIYVSAVCTEIKTWMICVISDEEEEEMNNLVIKENGIVFN
jgi:hypothetical protein